MEVKVLLGNFQLRRESIYNNIKMNKAFKNKFNQGGEKIYTLKTVKTLMKETEEPQK